MKRLFPGIAMAILATACCNIPNQADILIAGGELYNGTQAAFKADVAISGDRIIYVGKAKEGIERRCKAAKVIDAGGCVVCPGFIDPHDHLEPSLLQEKSCESYLRMGVTTVIPGMCGTSRYPISDFYASLEKNGIGPNVASFTGHNTIRNTVMGDVDRLATPEENGRMQEILKEEMANGSLGLSTGLYYVPGCFSDRDEVVGLCKAMAPLGGIYTTHVRNENKEGLGLTGSIREALEIGKAAGVRVNISHIKCLGKSMWHRADSVIDIIESYQKDGLEVTADQYPYLASGLAMTSALTPSWSRDGGVNGLRERLKDPFLREKIKSEIPDLIYERGGAETIFISRDAGEYSKMTLEQVAGKMGGVSPEEAVIRLAEDKSIAPYLNTFVTCEEDLEKYMARPWVLTCTDGKIGSHPRASGTYALMIERYVLDKNVISLERFIERSTSQVAATYGLEGRGVIETGAFADIIVFKPGEVHANSTYMDPNPMATGFKSVIINGKIAVNDDAYTGELSGKVLRKD